MSKFCDLCLVGNLTDGKQKKQARERAARFGYEVVAEDFKIHNLGPKAKIPKAPERSKDDVIESEYLQAEGKQLKSLSRLTVTLDETAQTLALRSESVMSYDLLAVRPTNEKMFHRACIELEVDIITCDLTTRIPFYFKYHSIKPALERGVHFEICYSPAIRDSTLRRSVFRNALSLVSACKGRNIIVSSGAQQPLELRGPHDITNLGHLFGLKEDQAKAAVSSNCQAAIMHGFTRSRTIKGVMSIQKVIDLAPEDLWMVKASLEASGFSVERLKEEKRQHEEKGGKRDLGAGEKTSGVVGKKQKR